MRFLESDIYINIYIYNYIYNNFFKFAAKVLLLK